MNLRIIQMHNHLQHFVKTPIVLHQPIELNFMQLRNERQRLNNLIAIETLCSNSNDTSFFSNCLKKNNSCHGVNWKEFNKVMNEIKTPLDELIQKCKQDKILATILGGRVSINASRQGCKDEEMQIAACQLTAANYDIIIKRLTPTCFRPTKSGQIITNVQYKKNETILKNDCLKSFDARISGNINGWIFAKVVFGNGGHQDNVFEEVHIFCDWVIKYNNEEKYGNNELYVVLCDTDMQDKIQELQEKYMTNTANLFVGNHKTFQEFLIQKYCSVCKNINTFEIGD